MSTGKRDNEKQPQSRLASSIIDGAAADMEQTLDMIASKDNGPKERLERLGERRHSSFKPIQLTCAVELEDELDLELTQIEWLLLNVDQQRQHQLASKSVPPSQSLIWRSNGYSSDSLASRKLSFNRTLLILDYVTRSVQAGPRDDAEIRQLALHRPSNTTNLVDSETPEAESRNDVEKQNDAKFVRVVHLILAPTAALGLENNPRRKDERLPLEFVCRITNKAGTSELVQPLLLILPEAQQQQHQNEHQAIDVMFASQDKVEEKQRPIKQSDFVHLQQLVHQLRLLQRREPSRRVEEAKVALAQVLNANLDPKQANFFLPLESPSWLTDLELEPDLNQIEVAGSQQSGKSGPSMRQISSAPAHLKLASGQPNDEHRATNSSSSSSRDARTSPEVADPLDSASQSDKIRLEMRGAALSLLARSTRALWSLERHQLDFFEPEDDENATDGLGVADVALSSDMFAKASQFASKMLRGSMDWLHRNHLDRWVQLALGHAPLVLAVCCGLLICCLLTMMLLLRLWFTKSQLQRRVHDSSSQSKRSPKMSTGIFTPKKKQSESEAEEEQEATSSPLDSNASPPSISELKTNPNEHEFVLGRLLPIKIQQNGTSVSGSSSSGATMGSQQRLIRFVKPTNSLPLDTQNHHATYEGLQQGATWQKDWQLDPNVSRQAEQVHRDQASSTASELFDADVDSDGFDSVASGGQARRKLARSRAGSAILKLDPTSLHGTCQLGPLLMQPCGNQQGLMQPMLIGAPIGSNIYSGNQPPNRSYQTLGRPQRGRLTSSRSSYGILGKQDSNLLLASSNNLQAIDNMQHQGMYQPQVIFVPEGSQSPEINFVEPPPQLKSPSAIAMDQSMQNATSWVTRTQISQAGGNLLASIPSSDVSPNATHFGYSATGSLTSPVTSSSPSAGTASYQLCLGNSRSQTDPYESNIVYLDDALEFLNESIRECLPCGHEQMAPVSRQHR